MPVEYKFDLKLQDGRVVTWNGSDGEDASMRYAESNREATVIAWRWPRHGLFIGANPIIEATLGLWR